MESTQVVQNEIVSPKIETIMEENSVSPNLENKRFALDIHPCQYCSEPCRGKQCKKCHFKMLSKMQSKCLDCDKIFVALRKDGSMRKRCLECQDEYTKKNYAKCAECDQQYHAIMADGRVFNKCFDCYKKSFTKCQMVSCDNTTYKGASLCSDCYKASKFTRERKTSPINYQNCKTDGCKNTTTYSFCRDCNNKKKSVVDNYMLFTCLKCGCRGRGDYKFCGDCN